MSDLLTNMAIGLFVFLVVVFFIGVVVGYLFGNE